MRILHVLTQVSLPFEALEDAVRFYRALFGEDPRLDITPAPRTRIVQVSSMLLVGVPPEQLERTRATSAAYVVEGLLELAEGLVARGARILEGPTEIPTGKNMVVEHPDGTRVEYVEHASPNPRDALLAARPAWSS